MTRVKICGLTREEDVDAVVDAGADAVGFISGFPTSPRDLPISRAVSLMSRVPPFVTTVLVTTADRLIADSELVKRAAPGAIQLYGGLFSPSSVRASMHARIIKPFSVPREERENREAAANYEILSRARDESRGYDGILVDTLVSGQRGGTGLTPDWSLCAAIRKAVAPTPLILSGGLRPENVELAIATVAPFCLDVSSGVESAPGVKDVQKVKEFLTKATPVGSVTKVFQ